MTPSPPTSRTLLALLAQGGFALALAALPAAREPVQLGSELGNGSTRDDIAEALDSEVSLAQDPIPPEPVTQERDTQGSGPSAEPLEDAPPTRPQSGESPGDEPATGAAPPPSAVSPAVVWEPRYHDLPAIEAFLAELAEQAPGELFARRGELGTSAGGRRLAYLEWGRPAADDARGAGESSGETGRGPGAAAEFFASAPTIVLLGGLDGLSLSGSEAVLSAAAELLFEPAQLPEGVAFLALPWAAPDALVGRLVGTSRSGRNAHPVDEDFDGLLDEDGPDDLDGDGLILDLLVEDPLGPWARAEDWRFLVPAREGDAPRYALYPEGRDDDRDGRYNEDAPGGIVVDRNFPVGWEPTLPAGAAGVLPLSEPSARLIANALLERRTVAVLLFQGNHGGLAAPGGASPERLGVALPAERHAGAFANLGADWSAATNRPAAPVRALREVLGEERPGTALDWIYTSVGAVALEVAPWGPELGGGAVEDGGARTAATHAIGPERLEPADRAWGRWLDNTRGGLGFVDWHPVDLGDGRAGLVGGWEPRTRLNPPDEELAATVRGMGAFTRAVARRVPRLEIELAETVRDGEVVRLGVRLRNRGSLPSGLTLVDGAPTTLRVALELPPGASLVAGPAATELPSLAGGASAPVLEWVLYLPQGKALSVTAEDRLAAPVRLEFVP